MDYLAAALEQEEPEEEELRVKLNWKEPLWGPVGENSDGKISPSAVPKEKNREAEDDQKQRMLQTEVSFWERGRDRAAEALEKSLRGRFEAIALEQPTKLTRNEDFTPLESIRTGRKAEWGVPLERRGQETPVALVADLKKVRAGSDFVRRERRNLTVTLPEAPVVAGSFSAEELDRAVERDARRYDGGFALY